MQSSEDVIAYIDRLKRMLSAETDKQLAEKLGFSRQTITSWRRRGKVPLAVEDELSGKYGPEAAFSNLMKFAVDHRENFVLYALFHHIREHYRDILPKAVGPEAETAWGQAMASCETDLRRAIRAAGFGYLAVSEVFAIMAKRIDEEAIYSVVRGVDLCVRGDYHPEITPFTPDAFGED